MTREEQVAKLQELKSRNYPKVTTEYLNIHPVLNKLSDSQKKKLNEYLSSFYKPTDERGNSCLWCDNSGITWGLAHGSAECTSCGWTYRTYHYLRDIVDDWNGDRSERIELSLQYHPDCFSVSDESEETE